MENNFKITHTTDYEEFKQFLLKLKPKTRYNFTHFGDITRRSIDLIIKKELDDKQKIKFFSYVDGKLSSYSFLRKFEKATKKHNCILGIVLSDNLQGQGYGKKICNHMIKYAWKNKIKKIWLTVYTDNSSALNLYKSLGFEIEGIFLNEEKLKNKPRHVVSMSKFKDNKSLNKKRFQLWKKLEEMH